MIQLFNRQYSALQFSIILLYMIFKVIEAMVDVMQGVNDTLYLSAGLSVLLSVICIIYTACRHFKENRTYVLFKKRKYNGKLSFFHI